MARSCRPAPAQGHREVAPTRRPLESGEVYRVVTTPDGHETGRVRPTRIPILEEEGRSARQQEIVEDLVVGPTVNIYATLVRHPELAAAMVNLGRTIRAGRIPGRHREILILRTGCNCLSEYELAQHYRVATQIGMTTDDMERVRLGPDAPGWDDFEATLCRAADELHTAHAISDSTWATLAERYDEQELIEVAMVVGYYHLVSFVLNSLGIPIEEGAPRFPRP
jgi:4-carboxymuconolactone decarboxylase